MIYKKGPLEALRPQPEAEVQTTQCPYEKQSFLHHTSEDSNVSACAVSWAFIHPDQQGTSSLSMI
jgi:hypothetical protein